MQAGAAANNQQGVLPALFGFQLGPGQGYVEALTPEQQHQVRCQVPMFLWKCWIGCLYAQNAAVLSMGTFS